MLYNSISNTTSDVYFQVKTQTISVCELTTSTQTPNLPCSFSGATSIVFKLSSYNGGVVPSFVSIDSTTGALSITAPSFSNSTDYSFNILSTVSGMTDPAQTIIKLNVKKNTAEDWGFIASETAKSLGSSIQGATAATALFSVGISFTNLSLLAILWSALNQMQILTNWIY